MAIDTLTDRARPALGKRAARAIILLFAVAATAMAAEDDRGPDTRPILRVNTGGATSRVTCVAFDPPGKTLYAGGWDKVVRAWTLNDEGQFVPDDQKTLRVPVGPGLSGAINAIAVSPDGRFVAMAGHAVMERTAGFRDPGIILPTRGDLTKEMRLDEGTIFVVDTETGTVRSLRGHLGTVLSLAFAPGHSSVSQEDQPNLPPEQRAGPVVLVSAALDFDRKSNASRACFRLWDVEEKRHLRAAWVEGFTEDNVATLPVLAIRRWGSGPMQVQVASAWFDGRLRIWNPDQKKQFQKADAYFNNGVVFLSDQQSLITTSFSTANNGRIRTWKVDRNGVQLDVRPELRIGPANGLLPAALALTSDGGQPVEPVAVVATLSTRKGEDGQLHATGSVELQLIRLDTRQRVVRTPIWTDTNAAGLKVPTLAASSDGRFLAVSGGPTHEVLVYETSELLQRRFQPQRLRGLSSPVIEAHLVNRDEEQGIKHGIYLKESPGGQELLFDFDTRELLPFPRSDGWKEDKPPPSGWAASRVAGSKNQLMVRNPAGQPKRIRLPEEQEEVTALALLPPSPQGRGAILAVASHDRGQPLLALFDVTSGAQLRQYSGHTERMRSLSFSADGRLLVSTAEDRTVRVWSLTDLDELIGKRGKHPGVTVEDEEDIGVEVVEVEADSPARASLKSGDRILGHLDSQKKLSKFQDARAFYRFFWKQTKPGDKISLRIQRAAQPPRDVPITAQQGIDERKPLFSFLLAEAVEGRPRQWIGWSPFGPFESSDQGIERYLGWHFNTGDRQQPTRFVDLHQYRDEYYREGLLSELYRDGVLSAPPDKGPLPQPIISLWIPELGPRQEKYEEQLLLRDLAQITLLLDLDFGFPIDRIEEVQCRFDGNLLERRFSPSGELQWKIDLSRAPWKRGVHEIQAIVRTNERPPQDFPQTILIRYQPPPPTIQPRSAQQTTVDEGEFAFSAGVTPAAGTPVDATLLNVPGNAKPQVVKAWQQLDRPTVLETKVPLQPGANYFRLVAENVGSLPGHEEAETVSSSFVVYHKPPMKPPEIAVRLVGPPVRAVEIGEQIQSTSSRLEITGSITSPGKLASATLQVGGNNEEKLWDTLPDAAANQPLTFRKSMELSVPQEVTPVWIRAQTDQGSTAEWHFQAVFDPPLPELSIRQPAPEERTVFQLAQPAAAKTTLKARLRYAPRLIVPERVIAQIQAIVEVGGQVVPARVNAKQREVSAEVPLLLGQNMLRIGLKYPWQDAHLFIGESIFVKCLQPPQPGVITVTQVPGKPDAELILVGRMERKPRIAIGNKPLLPDLVTFNQDTREFALMTRINPDRDRVVDISHPSLPRRIFPVQIPRPQPIAKPKSPPEILFLNGNTTETQRAFQLEFEIFSSSPLSRVVLQQSTGSAASDRILKIEGPELGEKLNETEKGFQLSGSEDIELKRGNNYLKLIATNADGDRVKSTVINRVPLPPSLQIDRIETAAGDRVDLRKMRKETTKVKGPLAFVCGNVTWHNDEDARLGKYLLAKVRVNGFQQLPIELGPAQGLTRRFRVPVLLSRYDNKIEIELPQLEHPISETRSFPVTCTEPTEDQRLHLLVVGVGTQFTGEELINRALKTLDARLTGSDTFETPVFKEGTIYGPLTGKDVDRTTVTYQLMNIQQYMQTRMTDLGNKANDVVILYYVGGELVFEASQFYLTTEPDQDVASLESKAIPSKELVTFVETTCGAHLFLLDVARRQAVGISHARNWPVTSHGAMLRYAWLKQDQNVPPNARLISALDNIVPRSSQLGDVADDLSVWFRRELVPQFSKSLTFDDHVPDSLSNLRLRKTAGPPQPVTP